MLAAALWAQPRDGPQVLTFRSDVDDTDQPYSIYLPKDFDPKRKYPLIISLHAAFSNHRLNLRRVFGKGNQPGESDAEASRHFPRLPDVGFIVVSPFARGTMGYRGIAEKDVLDVLGDVRRRFAVDEDRIYLTGIAMGGGGALWLGLTRPDIWAAVAVVCPEIPDGMEELAGNAVNLPVRLHHGAQDPVMPVRGSREWAKRLTAAGVRVEYHEYPDGKHNSWDLAYRNGAMFDWVSPLRKDRYPRKVSFATRQYKYSKAYWVEITGMAPGEIASVEAEFLGKNRIVLKTRGVRGLELRLKGHPLYAPSLPVTVVADGTTLRTRRLSFLRGEKGWTAVAYQRKPREKGPGTEGPLLDVVSGRHLYVYGTRDHPGPEEEARRRRQAGVAAEWSAARLKASTRFRVLADREVEAGMQTSHLILFGNRETNAIVARMADRLPMHLDAGAADYGLFYVWPDGDRYVAINSGLPFYTGADRVRRGGPRYLGSPYAVIETLGDFILFRGSLETVIVEGRFDQQWRLREDDVRRLGSSSTIHLRP